MTTIRTKSKPRSFSIGRRTVLMGAGLLAIGVIAPRFALAAPPFKVRHGPFDITVYSDGHMVVPATFIAENAPAAKLARVLKRSSAPSPNVWPKANIPLIRYGGDLILFDIGDGRKFQPTEGELLAALRSNGVDPGSITKVVLTHAHPDHIWGMLDASQQLNFPNAHYYVGAREWDFWMAADVASRLPEAFRSVVPETQRDLSAIKDRMTLIRSGDEIVSGMRAFDTPGHTPGHLSFELEGDGGLIITADALTHAIISVEYPNWHNGFDFDSSVAIATRKSMLDRASTDRIKLLSYHFPYPGTGHVKRAGMSYRFEPIA